MRSFKRDKNYDLTTNSLNDIQLAEDLQSCIEACESASMTMINEQIYNINEGLPNFKAIWNGKPNIRQFEVGLRRQLLLVPNVLEVVKFDGVIQDGKLIYNVTIKSNFGVFEVKNGY